MKRMGLAGVTLVTAYSRLDGGPWDTHYPFSTENVQEFRDFLLTCGGFEIS